MELRQGRAQKGTHGRRSERNEAVPQLLEVMFAENFSSAEVRLRPFPLEANESSPRVPAVVHLQRSLPRFRVVLYASELDRLRLLRRSQRPFRSRTHMGGVVVLIIAEPDLERRERKYVAAERV